MNDAEHKQAIALVPPGFREVMIKMQFFLLSLACIQLLAWLLPTFPEFKGIPYYLALHETLEVTSIVFSMMVFAIGWNSKGRSMSGHVALLASVYFWVGILDFLHVMSYGGMPDFLSPNDVQKHLNFWLSARVLTALILLTVALRPWTIKTSNAMRNGLFGLLFLFTSALAWVVFYRQSWLPDTFISGKGLTAFKKNTEYLVIVVHIVTAGILWQRMKENKSVNVLLLFGAVCILSMSEFFFTLYTTMTGSYNVLGHFYKVIADVLIYRAIVVEVIEQPYGLLKQAQEKFFNIFNSVTDGIELVALDGRIVDMNRANHQRIGYAREEILNRPLSDFVTPEYAGTIKQRMSQIANNGHFSFESGCVCKDGSHISIEVSSRVAEIDGQKVFLSISRDITERKKFEEALKNSQRQYERLAANISVGVYLLHTTKAGAFSFRYASPRFCAILGVNEGDIYRNSATAFAAIHPDDIQEFMNLNQIATQQRTRFQWEGRTVNAQQVYWTRIESRPDPQENGECLWDGIVTDISKQVIAEERLRIVGKVFDVSQEAIVITNTDNIITDVNQAFCDITGYSRDEALGRTPDLLNSGRHDKGFYEQMWQTLKEKKAWRGEVWNRRKSGEIFPEWLSISIIPDKTGQAQHYVAVFSDISHIKAHEAELIHAAQFDALTGIPNRVLLADRMRLAILQAARDQTIVAICYLDLDGFKAINDQMGHECGDRVLVEVAKRVGHAIRAGDTVARLGGDEFVVLLQELSHSVECVSTLERILASIAQPISLNERQFHPTVSIGVSMYPMDDDSPDTLLRHADQAMYIAKQSGKNRYHIFDPSLDLRAREQSEFIAAIRCALTNHEFELYYQPKVRLHDVCMIGVEALIRWHHPERGIMLPAQFLPFIENIQLDIEIGNWVIATALQQISAWHKAGIDLEVSINISSHHLESKGFIDYLRQQMELHPDTPFGRLQIEVLETAALMNMAVAGSLITSCHSIGVSVALDDFGTGFSSLAYLSKLPVDVLKIDQSFIRDMLEDEKDRAIVNGIIKLSEAFGLRTVAEGVETEAQCQMLVEMGCKFGQGYAFAQPMPADQFLVWYSENPLLAG